MILFVVDVAFDRISVVGRTALLAVLPSFDVYIFEEVVTDEFALVCTVGSECR